MHESFQCISICAFFQRESGEEEEEEEKKKKRMSADFSLVDEYGLIGGLRLNRFSFSSNREDFIESFN